MRPYVRRLLGPLVFFIVVMGGSLEAAGKPVAEAKWTKTGADKDGEVTALATAAGPPSGYDLDLLFLWT